MLDRNQRQSNCAGQRQRRPRGLWITIAIGVVLICMTWSAFGALPDRRVSMAEAQVLANRARGQSEFPIVVNDLVLKALNHYIGNPERRESMRKALQQMENVRSVVEAKIKEYNVPIELMAIPIIESGYKNLAKSGKRVKSTGIWQFIPATARSYGLRVDEAKDERLDIPLATDAALRYLQASKRRFNDWLLGLLAYNVVTGGKLPFSSLEKLKSHSTQRNYASFDLSLSRLEPGSFAPVTM